MIMTESEHKMTWLGVTDRPWIDKAACRGLPPSWFFPIAIGSRPTPKRVKVADPLRVCAECPVGPNGTDECYAWAVENNQRDGIWGGRLLRNGKVVKK